MSHPLRVGLMFRPQGFSIETQRQVWRDADEAGFDHLWGFDHLFAVGPEPQQPTFEGWTALAAMAEVTKRTRIGLQVTGNLYRHPGLLAKMAVTVDHLSNGRLEMGIGAAWNEPEFAMLDMPFPGARERIERLGEACAVLKALWTQPRANFVGQYYTLRDAIAEPKPIQKPYPPIWIGGSGPKRTLRVVAEHADVWSSNSPGFDEDMISSRLLDEHCAAIGRDPATIRRSMQIRWGGHRTGAFTPITNLTAEVDETCSVAERYWKAGFSDLLLMANATGEDALRVAEACGNEVLPRLRSLA